MKSAHPARRNALAAVVLIVVLLAPMAAACALTPAAHTGPACACCDHLQVMPGASCSIGACSAPHSNPVLPVALVTNASHIVLHHTVAVAPALITASVNIQPQTARVGVPPGLSPIPLRI